MTNYRRQNEQDQWHWRNNCPEYPLRYYEETITNTRPVNLCDKCRELEKESSRMSRPGKDKPIAQEIVKPPEDTVKLSAHDWYNKGITAYQKLNFEAALKAFNKSLEIDPAQPMVWYHKGGTLGEMEQYDEALIAYDQAILLDPRYPLIWRNKCDVLIKLGRIEEALAACNKALEICAEDALVWYRKATIHARLKDKQNTLSCMSKAIDLNSRCRRMAQGNSDFQCFKDDAEFQKLML